MKKDEIVKYWIESADLDFRAMDSLFSNSHYVWALFIGHLVIEKLLKACYAKNVDREIPYTHDLLKIAEKSGLELTNDQKLFLDEVTTFNMRARYPDYKKKFYKKATGEFSGQYIVKIKEFREWLLKRTSA